MTQGLTSGADARDFGQLGTTRSQDMMFDREFMAMADTVANSISNLEKRLTTCSGVYGLAASASEIRDRERSAYQEAIDRVLSTLDDRITGIEDTVAQIPTAVKHIIADEFPAKERDEQLEDMVRAFVADAEARIDEAEAAIDARSLAQKKAINVIRKELAVARSTPQDNDSVVELESALREVALKQTSINDMMATLSSGGAPRQ